MTDLFFHKQDQGSVDPDQLDAAQSGVWLG